ncbi:hypothetical protein RB195_011370 [Necator americanus]|uniref:Endonuclease/exonuclease/phosphatase domain-containing protein n=2 Tax=Necator americanus TaxID=51031 RepID=A0ABR1D245_NECAM
MSENYDGFGPSLKRYLCPTIKRFVTTVFLNEMLSQWSTSIFLMLTFNILVVSQISLENWFCGQIGIIRLLSYNSMSGHCWKYAAQVNHCCAMHDNCYDLQHGRNTCDNNFCNCLEKVETRMLTAAYIVAKCLHDLMWNVTFISTMMSFTSFYMEHYSVITVEGNKRETYALSNDSKSCLYYIGIEGVLKEARAYPRSDAHCPRPGNVANMRGLPARGRSRPKKLVRHRQQHPVRLATLNVGTLTGRSRELADSLRKRRVDICCVQETRWKGSKARELGDGYKLIYHGTSNRNGVGIILNESFRNSVTAVDRLSDRLMAVKVDTGEVELRVVSAYAPQMGCGEEEKACFWEDLEQSVQSLEGEEVLLIGGDFNGHRCRFSERRVRELSWWIRFWSSQRRRVANPGVCCCK